jgi:hypothetical protein
MSICNGSANRSINHIIYKLSTLLFSIHYYQALCTQRKTGQIGNLHFGWMEKKDGERLPGITSKSAVP